MFKLKLSLAVLGFTVIGVPVSYAEPVTSAGSTVLSKSESNTSAIDGLLQKARYWKVNGRMDLAENIWARVLRSNPEQVEALAGESLYQATMGNAANATSYLARLRRANPQHPVVAQVEAILAPKVAVSVVGKESAESNLVAAPKPPAVTDDIKQAHQHLVAGNLHDAELSYLRALKKSPTSSELLLDLANVTLMQNKFNDVLLYVDRHDQKHTPTSVSKRLRSVANSGNGKLAEEAGDLSLAEKSYAQAYAANPNEPWVSLSYAKVLRKQGDSVAANALIEKMVGSVYSHDSNVTVSHFYPTSSDYVRDRNFAASLYYSEAGQWSESLVLLDQIPEHDRTTSIKELHARSIVYVKSDLATKLYTDKAEAEGIQMLSSVEEDAKDNPELVAVVTSAWLKMNQHERSAALLERNIQLDPSFLQHYAGLLLQTGQDVKLQGLFDEVDAPNSKHAPVKDSLDNIRIALRVRQVETLRGSASIAHRQSILAPMLQKHPNDTNLLLAHGRLLADEGHWSEVLKNADHVLTAEPRNREALRQGVVGAIRLGDYPQADMYLHAAKEEERQGLCLEAGYAAQAVQNDDKAAAYFAAAGVTESKPAPVDMLTSPEMQYAGNDVQHERYVDVGFGMRHRTGTPGLGQLREKEVPVALHIPLQDKHSSIVLKATDIRLDAGDAGLAFDMFGRNLPAIPLVVPYPMRANGLALSVGYQSAALSADVGLAPVGFLFNDLVGGVRWNRDISNTNLAIEATRRSVTESLLSYAGAVDNVTGLAWGGVSKTGAQVSLYYPFVGPWAGYSSVGLYGYTGHNTAANESIQINTSLIYQLVRTDDFDASIAGRLSKLSFNNNQNYFYWGHGGYYSPQSDTSLSIPLRVSGKTQRFSYELNLSASISNVVESPAQIYPTDPALQAGMGAAGMTLGANSAGKQSRHADWVWEYAFAQQWAVGNRFHYDESPIYQQVGGMVYLRYDFESGRPTTFPTNALRPYYLTSQGGAGLN